MSARRALQRLRRPHEVRTSRVVEGWRPVLAQRPLQRLRRPHEVRTSHAVEGCAPGSARRALQRLRRPHELRTRRLIVEMGTRFGTAGRSSAFAGRMSYGRPLSLRGGDPVRTAALQRLRQPHELRTGRVVREMATQSCTAGSSSAFASRMSASMVCAVEGWGPSSARRALQRLRRPHEVSPAASSERWYTEFGTAGAPAPSPAALSYGTSQLV